MTSNSDSGFSREDAEAQFQLCEVVGVCLGQFSSVEESLAALYGIAAEMPSMEAAFKTHVAIREFSYRLAATDELVRFWIDRLDDAEAKSSLTLKWKSLHKAIRETSEDRNRIAHFSLNHETDADGKKTWYVCPYFQIYAHITEINKSNKAEIPKGTRKFDYATMRAKLKRFANTAKRIDEYINDVISHGGQLPK